jgi:hypothetical protein
MVGTFSIYIFDKDLISSVKSYSGCTFLTEHNVAPESKGK